MSAFTLPDLPFDYGALEPFMSKETLRFHHDKHHKAYVDTANKMLDSDPELRTVYDRHQGDVAKILPDVYHTNRPFFNNLAQHWNHSFFWSVLAPSEQKAPEDLIGKFFSNYDTFCDNIVNSGMGQFGSGWVWLYVCPHKKLHVGSTPNAESPLLKVGHVPVLVCDVWEHSYYLDYQNRRKDYLVSFIRHVVNWEAVLGSLKKAGIS